MQDILKHMVRAGATIAVLASSLPAQVQIVPRDSIVRPRDAQPWIPADTTAEVTHVVKPGDTLWGLARQYLNNPFRWPDVFRRNTDVVENPHWIYPGEVLRMPSAAVRPEALRVAESEGRVVARVETVPVGVGTTIFSSSGLARSRPVTWVGGESSAGARIGEVDAAPFVTPLRGPAGAGRIIGTADREGVTIDTDDHRFQIRDDAYIEVPSDAQATPGAQFLVVAEGPELFDTARVMVPTGIVRVIEAPSGARPAKARVVRQFGEILIRHRLVPLPSERGAVAAPTPMATNLTGRVAWVHNDPVLPTVQHYVILSLPTGWSASVGDKFMLVDQTRLGHADRQTPPEDAALVEVVRVTPFAATAIVVAQRLPTIVAGMHARPTARQ